MRAEHDVNRDLQLRFQSRYNRTSREAVLSTIQNPAAFDATTNLVTDRAARATSGATR